MRGVSSARSARTPRLPQAARPRYRARPIRLRLVSLGGGGIVRSLIGYTVQRRQQQQQQQDIQEAQRAFSDLSKNMPALRINVDASDAIAGLREARREFQRHAAKAMAEAAARTILPEAESRVPSWAKGTIVARGRVRGQVITTTLRGTRARTLGLLEHGGTVKGPIHPKRKKALRTPHGVFAQVGPHSIKPKRMIRGAVERRFTDYQDALLPEVMRAFDRFPHQP